MKWTLKKILIPFFPVMFFKLKKEDKVFSSEEGHKTTLQT